MIPSKITTEPSDDQCNKNEVVYSDKDYFAFAAWYPQMGGSCGKCVVMRFSPDSEESECIDVFVWHDGEFPFCGSESDPKAIHHCSPSQFIEFGEKIMEMTWTRRKEI